LPHKEFTIGMSRITKHLFAALPALVALMVLACAASLSSCGSDSRGAGERAVYYWSTTMRMDSLKEDFIRKHNINKVYLRYFDVVVASDGNVMPNATITFDNPSGTTDASPDDSSAVFSFTCPLPDTLEVVPVVFIVNNCMKRNVSQLPEMILKRVMQMTETHDVQNVREIQIDCDWTVSTQQTFFNFMEQLHKLTKEAGLRLSATIRLHQLMLPPPSCDEGVLMVYNTGDMTQLNGRNPILDSRDAMPYLKHLKKYKLPLSAAYPIYRWQLLYRGGRFVGVIHHDGEYPVLDNDSIYDCQVDIDTILKVKDEITKINPRTNNRIILFDLNNHNISRFNDNDYEKIYQQ